MAFHFRAVVSSRGLLGLLLVGPEGNFADRFLLGCLAWLDANLRLLPHLRRENWNLCRSHAPARFRHVCDLVRYRCGAFAISPERHARHVLYVWRAIYSADCGAPWSATDPIGGDRSFGPVPRSFPSDVDHRPPAEPREGGLTDHEHRVLVVLD